MIFRPKTLAAFTATIALISGAVQAQSVDAKKGAAPASVTAISPIWGQLVRFSMPTGFVAAFENTKGNFYIREAVPKGETVKQWTQMITVTGGRGLAGAPNFSAENQAATIVGGFKKACPQSFAVKVVGPSKLGNHDAFTAVAGCGSIGSGTDAHAETLLIVAVKGITDGYTIQWAERGPATSSGAAIDEAKWQERLRALMPIRLCAIVPGEAAPYPSCLQQK